MLPVGVGQGPFCSSQRRPGPFSTPLAAAGLLWEGLGGRGGVGQALSGYSHLFGPESAQKMAGYGSWSVLLTGRAEVTVT